MPVVGKVWAQRISHSSRKKQKKLPIFLRGSKYCPIPYNEGWKPHYLALGCQFQFRYVETQMAGFSFGLVSRLLKNRFQFRFQFCLRTASVSGFQFRFKFHPKKLFYFE